MSDTKYMELALKLAEKGCGTVAPNPMVGAVIVKDGRIIGEGYHKKAGMPHAERIALDSCRESPRGATLYVTLEPCCHHGRTPPCTDAVIQAGIGRVVVGSADPNPQVGGKGLQILREHGIPVTEHVCEEECIKLNQIFFYYIRHRRPFVVMKYAMTMDGKIATRTGASKWITGEAAREHVHQTRHRLTAIMAGVGTVLADDPLLTSRIPGGRNPIRIICDTHLRTPLHSRLVSTAGDVPTIIATGIGDSEKHRPFIKAGCQVWKVPLREHRIDLPRLMDILGDANIDSLLLEGGSAMHGSALETGIVQKIQCYIAPRMFGGASAPSPVGGKGAALPHEGWSLGKVEIIQLGQDILLESEVTTPCSQG